MQSGFGADWLSELKAKNDIITIIERYIPLTKKGKTYWGRCPFHNEKTASFAVNSLEQYYHCFGCNASGDVIRFVMEMENFDFVEAVKFLAENAGMQLPELKDNSDLVRQKQEKAKLYQMMKEAARHYYFNFQKPAAVTALQYLEKRCIEHATIVKFGLGYSLNRKALISELASKGYTTKQMLDAGLIAESTSGYQDALAGRLIYPILDSMGNVIAFGGRQLEQTGFAKYKNTGDTKLFNKSRNLYGVNLLKKVKQAGGMRYVIMVEGYMDTISLVQAGITNVVASMGTSLTVEQARLLMRYTDLVYISYDGDSAGRNATLRGLDILRQEGLEVRIISLPQGKDPDDIIKEEGAEGYHKLIEEAMPLIEYKLKLAEVGLSDDADSRAKYVDRALAVLKQLSSRVEQMAYIPYVKERSGFFTDDLVRQLDRLSLADSDKPEINRASKAVVSNKSDNETSYYSCARIVLSVLINNKLIEGEDLTEYFADEQHRSIYAFIVERRLSGKKITVSDVYSNFPQTEEIDRIVAAPYDTREGELFLTKSLARLKQLHIEGQKKELLEAIKEEKNADKRAELLQKLNRLLLRK